jgi:hypothetical protein
MHYLLDYFREIPLAADRFPDALIFNDVLIRRMSVAALIDTFYIQRIDAGYHSHYPSRLMSTALAHANIKARQLLTPRRLYFLQFAYLGTG